MVKEIVDVAYHRNGISGEPFYIIKFIDRESDVEMIGILFDKNKYCAVFDLNLAHETIKFMENSFRGDNYEPELRKAIEKYEKQRDKEFSKKFLKLK